jgi:hypothetical protein
MQIKENRGVWKETFLEHLGIEPGIFMYITSALTTKSIE